MAKSRIFLGVATAFVGAALSFFSSSGVSAALHGGGLDSYGCHNDTKAGNYHCHRGLCSGKTFGSRAAMLADACSKAAEKPAAAAKPTKPAPKSDAEIKQAIISESIASYRGSCPCPYNTDR